jgi:hypothetical protein
MQLEELKSELNLINQKIEQIEATERNSYSAQMAKTFHLGMVGGSGNRKNIYKLNARREKDMDKSIAQAKVNCALYDRKGLLEKMILDIESGADVKRQVSKDRKNQALADWWKALKVGDTFSVGNGPMKISKVNAKSIVSEGGCKWNVIDIIGKKAASLLV